jgi:hypothetical protein
MSADTQQSEKEMFPGLCLRYHWDPTMVSRWTLPQESFAMPLDPRPWTKVCLTYTTSSPHQRAPDVPASYVLPTGGPAVAGPPNRYLAAIDKESLLRRLDRPLTKCDQDKVAPGLGAPQSTVPPRSLPMTQFMSDLSMPKVLLRTAPYDCRAREDLKNLQKNQQLFNNTTKYAKYKETRPSPQPSPQFPGSAY